jgi:hypothetical protein
MVESSLHVNKILLSLVNIIYDIQSILNITNKILVCPVRLPKDSPVTVFIRLILKFSSSD